jgi:glycerate-2-kinase
MSAEIQNLEEIAFTPARRKVLEVVQAGLNAIDTIAVVKENFVLSDDSLKVCGKEYNLKDYKHIYVVGFGKASGKAAVAVEEVLGARIAEGLIISLTAASTEHIKVVAGTHPLPSEQNVSDSEQILEISKKAKEDDLIICIISGGGSALFCGDMEECEQDTRLYTEYLKTNGEIKELNTVRKHISSVKGGGLAKALYPSTVIGLVFSDIAGSNCNLVTSGPTYYDESTVADAQKIIDKYNLGKFALRETPKDKKYFEKVSNFEIVSNVKALQNMVAKAKELGIPARILTSACYSEAKEAFAMLENDCKKGELVLAGGEVRVTITRTGGTGGRCQYTGMAVFNRIVPGETFCAFASDGLDNSKCAGVIIDSDSQKRAAEQKIDQASYLENFDGYGLFAALGKEQIFTGITESNVSDWLLLYKE